MNTLRIVLSVLLLAHAAVHLIGVRKWTNLAGRTFAFLYFGAFAALATGALLLFLEHDAWWKVTLPGILLSQALIIAEWSEAKVGTIANAIVLVPAIATAAHAHFTNRIDTEVTDMIVHQQRLEGDQRASFVEQRELDRLPPPVRQWLEASGTVGRERAHTVWLAQRGELRTGLDQPWLKIAADQTFTVDEPAFVWKVETKMMGFVPVLGRDRYTYGQGEMLVKAASLVNVANARDEKTTQGAMLRYLGEIVWFPSAALAPYIVWEPIDDARARATMHHANRTVSADFSFDGAGRVTTVRAMRWYGSGAEAKLTPWYVPCTDWREVRGVVVPVRGDVVWQLPEGDFSYFRWEIVDIETNRREGERPPEAQPLAVLP